jgi:hypothetical protein
MSYNRIYLLKKIIEIQNIVLKETSHGVRQIWVYKNMIKPRFFVSFSTFNNYMSINAKAELEKLENETNCNKNQPAETFRAKSDFCPNLSKS